MSGCSVVVVVWDFGGMVVCWVFFFVVFVFLRGGGGGGDVGHGDWYGWHSL